jgi:hypothetical protein
MVPASPNPRFAALPGLNQRDGREKAQKTQKGNGYGFAL